MAAVGAGTGLGEVFLTPRAGGGLRAWPSEGGMAEFAPRTEEQWRLRRWLLAREYPEMGGHVTVEAVGNIDDETPLELATKWTQSILNTAQPNCSRARALDGVTEPEVTR